tara:strand:+ start:15331 stop:15747 length:417 start_codon:yes stop_codon:yes gene_type:complete
MGLRLKGWESRLAAFVETAREVPFKWGENDCVTLAADVTEAIAGFDFMADFRGTYRDRRGAARAIRDRGGLASHLLALGFARTDDRRLLRGDVVLTVDAAGEDTLRVYIGGSFIGPGESGLEFLDKVVIVKAFTLCRP